MASLGLVAYYGSSDEEGSDVDEQEVKQKGGENNTKNFGTTKSDIDAATGPVLNQAKQDVVKSGADDIHISDEEDYLETNAPSVSSTAAVSVSKFLTLPPPATKSSNDPLVPLQPSRSSNSVQAPLTGPQLEEDIVQSSSTVLRGLPVPKTGETSRFMYDDELEDTVKPKSYEKEAPKPPPKAKKRQPVKITVPNLFDYSDEEDEPQAKRPTQSHGKTKLFAMLPEPKNVATKQVNRPLIPHTLSKKPTPAPKPAAKKPTPGFDHLRPKIIKTKTPPLVQLVADPDSEEEEDSGPINFFDIGKGDSEPANQTAATFSFSKDQSVVPLVAQVETEKSEMEKDAEVMPGPMMMYEEDDEAEPYGGEVQQYLHDDEFLKIQGKKHRGKEEINIIDVNMDDQVDRSDLMKTISEEKQMSSHSRKRKDMPTSQQRRKHQITYLAFQAKERELELKNQWASNRQSKKQTQSKYGF